MKCPDCEYVFSDLRDICPKCCIDLREFKRERGMQVTQPHATYQQLVEKHSLKFQEQSGGETESFLSRLTGLISNPASFSAPAESSDRSSDTTSDALDDATFEEIDEQSDPTEDFEQGEADESVLEPTQEWPYSEIETQPDSNQSITSDDYEPGSAALLVETPAGQIRLAGSDGSQEVSSSLPEPTSLEKLEVAALFQDCFDELRDFEETGFNIEFNQLADFSNREDIELLFQMARESIDSPEVEELYKEDPTTTRSHQIRDSMLQRALERAERTLDAPVFGLKAKRRKKRAAVPAEGAEVVAPVQLKPAGVFRRLLSFAVDLVVFATVAIGIAILCLQLLHPELQAQIGLGSSGHSYQMVLFVGYLLLSSFLLAFTFSLFSTLILGQTPGALLLGIEHYCSDRDEPASLWSHIVLSAAYPFSLIFFGYLPVLFGRPSLHERLAGVSLVKELE